MTDSSPFSSLQKHSYFGSGITIACPAIRQWQSSYAPTQTHSMRDFLIITSDKKVSSHNQIRYDYSTLQAGPKKMYCFRFYFDWILSFKRLIKLTKRSSFLRLFNHPHRAYSASARYSISPLGDISANTSSTAVHP